MNTDIEDNLYNKPYDKPVHTNCEPSRHLFCQKCILDFIKESAFCPKCNQKLHAQDLAPTDVGEIINELDNLLVKCSTCKQSDVKRIDFKVHYQEKCPKVIIPCPASEIMCHWKGQRSELENHLKNCILNEHRPILTTITQRLSQTSEQRNRPSFQNKGPIDETKQPKDKVHQQRTRIPRLVQANYQQMRSGYNSTSPIISNENQAAQQFQKFLDKVDQQQNQYEATLYEKDQMTDQKNRLETLYTDCQQENQEHKNEIAQLRMQLNASCSVEGQQNNTDQIRNFGLYPPVNSIRTSPVASYAHDLSNNNFSTDSSTANQYFPSDFNNNLLNNGEHNASAYQPSRTVLIPISIPISVNTNISGVSDNNGGRGNNNISGNGNSNICGGNHTIPGGVINNIIGGRNIGHNNNAHARVDPPNINHTARVNNTGNNNKGTGYNNITGSNNSNIIGGNYDTTGSVNNRVGCCNNLIGVDHNDGGVNVVRQNTNYNNDFEDHRDRSVMDPADDNRSEISSVGDHSRENPDRVRPPNDENYDNY